MDENNKIGLAIKRTRIKKNLSATELCKLANVPKSSLSDWEMGKTQPSAKSFIRILNALNVSALELIANGKEQMNNYNTSNDMYYKNKVPILGRIACGNPIYSQDYADCYVTLPDGVKADYGLYAQGDSMIDARILDGDLVWIKSQPTVENGEIAAVQINGDEATLKRVYYDQDKQILTLIPCNKSYSPMIFTGEDKTQVEIIGKAIIFQSEVR